MYTLACIYEQFLFHTDYNSICFSRIKDYFERCHKFFLVTAGCYLHEICAFNDILNLKCQNIGQWT